MREVLLNSPKITHFGFQRLTCHPRGSGYDPINTVMNHAVSEAQKSISTMIFLLFDVLFLQLSALHDIQQALKDAQLEEHRKRELASALHIHFKDWLYGNPSFS